MDKQQQKDMNKDQSQAAARGGKQPNEGEGNRTAARDYNQRTEKFVHSGKVEESAKRAERAVEGGERADLEKAEEIGKRHAKH
jgi:hypothetical protein